MNQAMTPLDFAVHAMRVNGGAPCDIAAAESAEGELRALREDRASIDAMAILLGRARDERDSARTQLAEKDAALQAAIQRAEEADAGCLQTIKERDDAEDALSDAFRLVTGREPEWSNVFGYADAMEEITEMLDHDRSQRDALQARVGKLEEALDKIIHNSDIWSEYDMARFARAALASREGGEG